MEGNDQAARAEDAKHRTGYYPPIGRETMTTGNPYKLSNDRVIDILELVPRGAEEALVQAGYAAGKAEQAEIVSELVGACDGVLSVTGYWLTKQGRKDLIGALEKLQEVVAKAKGE